MIYVFATAKMENPTKHIEALASIEALKTQLNIKVISVFRSLEDEKEQHVYLKLQMQKCLLNL
jgi:hypothetical protein